MNFPYEPDPNLPPSEAAAWWLARIVTDSSRETQERLVAWQSRCPENAEAYQKMRLLWTLTGQAEFQPGVMALRKRALVRHLRMDWRMAAAAGIAALVVSGGAYFATTMRNTSPMQPASVQTAVAEQIYRTQIGQTRRIQLVDGSVASLDGDSALKVVYSNRERALFLVRGQAAFEVAKHQTRPFVVRAGDRRITATGTFFNVDMTSNRLEVTLLEGRVIVERPSRAGNRAELLPGQQLRVHKQGPDIVSVVDVNQATAWRSGRLYFVNERLDDAVEEINRHAHNQIVLAERGLGTLKVSGSFRTGQTAEFLRALKLVYPVSDETTATGEIAVRSTSR